MKYSIMLHFVWFFTVCQGVQNTKGCGLIISLSPFVNKYVTCCNLLCGSDRETVCLRHMQTVAANEYGLKLGTKVRKNAKIMN